MGAAKKIETNSKDAFQILSDILETRGLDTSPRLLSWKEPEEVHGILNGLEGYFSREFLRSLLPAVFWRRVYLDLGIQVEVPPRPIQAEKRCASLETYRFLPIYIPPVTEEQYPKDFIKPNWGQYINVVDIERKPLLGQWIAIETIAKPNRNDDIYPDDRLMAALKRTTRFRTSYNALTGGILAEVSKVMRFPKTGIRLPSAEEWNFAGNLFNWLRVNRSMSLPELGSTTLWEWCKNACGSDRLRVGSSERGGLALVDYYWLDNIHRGLGFRVLAVL